MQNERQQNAKIKRAKKLINVIGHLVLRAHRPSVRPLVCPTSVFHLAKRKAPPVEWPKSRYKRAEHKLFAGPRANGIRVVTLVSLSVCCFGPRLLLSGGDHLRATDTSYCVDGASNSSGQPSGDNGGQRDTR